MGTRAESMTLEELKEKRDQAVSDVERCYSTSEELVNSGRSPEHPSVTQWMDRAHNYERFVGYWNFKIAEREAV